MSSLQSVKRPKRGETEDDLLRQQNEFLARNNANQVKNESITADTSERKTSESIADNHDLPPIVCNIVEKNVGVDVGCHSAVKCAETGFPIAMRIDNQLRPKRGLSLFAQQMGAKKRNDVSDEHVISGGSVVAGSGLGVKDWKREMMTIRRENEQLLSGLSADQIWQMRSEISDKLSPNIIEFIHNKSQLKNDKTKYADINVSSNIDVEMKDEQSLVESDETSIPIKQSEVIENKWLNMNIIEKSKLSWIGDLPPTDESVSHSARFDLEGFLVDSGEHIGVDKALHHHSDEPSNAGYTIQELLTFLQSSYASQKVLAIQILAKIFEKSYNGLYDACFNENIISELLENSSLVLQMRLCLDDSADTIWKMAINGLRAIICNTVVDEAYLDRAFLLLNDESLNNDLKPRYDMTIKIDELSDDQFARLDIIDCLVRRTNLLERIRFLFEENSLDLIHANHLLDILIRIARHSNDLRQSIIKCNHLLGVIIKNFVPISVNTLQQSFSYANVKALKLIRLLTNNSKEISAHVIANFPSIVDSLKVFITLNPDNCRNYSEILQISIEALRVWLYIIPQNSAEFLDLFPIIVKHLQYCQTMNPISHTNQFDWHYASTLISVLKNLVLTNAGFSGFNDLVCATLFKWLSCIKSVEMIPNFDPNMSILSAIEFILVTNIDTNLLIDNVVSHVIDNKIVLNKLVDLLIENSNLLNIGEQTQGTARDATNLPSFGSIYYRKLQTIVILNSKSSICLLYAIVKILSTLPNENFVNNLLLNERIYYYISKVIDNIRVIKLNIFDLYELNLLADICLLSASMPNVQTEQVYHFVNLSLLIVCFIKNDTQRFNLVNRVIFNKSLFDSNLLDQMSLISINDVNTNTRKSINFEQIRATYIKYSSFDTIHWLFAPIIKSLNSEIVSNDDIVNCLSFINLITSQHENFLHQIIGSTSTAFYLISTVFLLTNDLYFDFSAQHLLYDVLKKLLNYGVNCQLDDKILHFPSLTNFFGQFVNQFESVSYGNKLFANYLLVFCQRKCSQLFRSKLFSENSSVLQILSNKFDEIVIPVNNFLLPIENDFETLECYLKALLCGFVTPLCSPLLYLMAIHHLNHALFRNTKIVDSNAKIKFDRLMRSVRNSSNEQLKHHLLKYSHFDSNCLYGLRLTD